MPDKSKPDESSQPVALNPHRFSPSEAMVALLDALGARNYSQEQAAMFLGVRDEILAEVRMVADKPKSALQSKNFRIFVFNDTVIFGYLIDSWTSEALNQFCGVIRAVQTAFLLRNILFRGAISMGILYEADEKRNTIMGPALSDAAAWYERADWVGVNATPRASIQIRSWLQETPEALDHMLIDYDVPLTGGRKVNLKALNWPKSLYLAHDKDAKRARADLFSRFAALPIPDGTESKYLNALQFFDHCRDRGLLQKRSDG